MIKQSCYLSSWNSPGGYNRQREGMWGKIKLGRQELWNKWLKWAKKKKKTEEKAIQHQKLKSRESPKMKRWDERDKERQRGNINYEVNRIACMTEREGHEL